MSVSAALIEGALPIPILGEFSLFGYGPLNMIGGSLRGIPLPAVISFRTKCTEINKLPQTDRIQTCNSAFRNLTAK